MKDYELNYSYDPSRSIDDSWRQHTIIPSTSYPDWYVPQTATGTSIPNVTPPFQPTPPAQSVTLYPASAINDINEHNEFINFAHAMADQFGLDDENVTKLDSGDAVQVKDALTVLAHRVGDAVNEGNLGYDEIKARFVRDLRYLKDHTGFVEVIKIIREITKSVAELEFKDLQRQAEHVLTELQNANSKLAAKP